jgi:hypothetical protein
MSHRDGTGSRLAGTPGDQRCGMAKRFQLRTGYRSILVGQCPPKMALEVGSVVPPETPALRNGKAMSAAYWLLLAGQCPTKIALEVGSLVPPEPPALRNCNTVSAAHGPSLDLGRTMSHQDGTGSTAEGGETQENTVVKFVIVPQHA